MPTKVFSLCGLYRSEWGRRGENVFANVTPAVCARGLVWGVLPNNPFIMNKLFGTVLLLVALAASSHGQVSFSGSYSQNFNSLGSTASAGNGSAVSWSSNTTLSGWYLINGASSALTTYTPGDGSLNTGSIYSLGAAGSSDRALGSIASGGAYFGSPASAAVAAYIAFSATNSSGGNYSSFTLSYDSEQWRNGGNTTAQSFVAQYGFGSTFAGVTSWTAAGAGFNLVSKVNTATAAAVDGNSAGLTSSIGGTVTTTWSSGSTLWVRFIELNDVGNDHGLGVDNFSLTAASAIPEPSTYAAILGGAVLLGVAARRRRSA